MFACAEKKTSGIEVCVCVCVNGHLYRSASLICFESHVQKANTSTPPDVEQKQRNDTTSRDFDNGAKVKSRTFLISSDRGPRSSTFGNAHEPGFAL